MQIFLLFMLLLSPKSLFITCLPTISNTTSFNNNALKPSLAPLLFEDLAVAKSSSEQLLSNAILLGGGSPYSSYRVSASHKPIFSYIGCFADKREMRDIGEKDFTFLTKYNKSMPTVELCVLLCSQDGFRFAGVQAFDECYCGNSYGRYNETNLANCFFQCGGKYTCGGYNANSVYYISKQSSNYNINSNSNNKNHNNEIDRALAMSSSISANPCQNSPCQNSGICVTLMDDKVLLNLFNNVLRVYKIARFV